jgi:PAS domain S-box-containing protein
MTGALSLLVIEDSESDADLIIRTLQRAGYDVRAERIEEAAQMRAALTRQSWDVVICDYSLPQFDAPAALALLQQAGLDLPFLIVSGAIGEDTAVAMMKSGAHDYLMKSNLTRLAPAVEREIREAEMRRERRVAEGVISRLAAIVESSEDAIIGKTLDGIVVHWNQGAEKLYGYAAADIVGRSIALLIPSDRPDELRQVLEKIKRGEVVSHFETKRQKKDGTIIDVALTVSPIKDATGRVTGASSIARDITERKRAEDAVRQAKEDWERTFDAVPDLIAILDTEHRIVRANRSMAARLGMTLNKCIGQKCYALVHGTNEPLDYCPHTQLLADGCEHAAEVREDRLCGDFFESVSPLRDSNGELVGSVHVARDITGRKRAEEALRHSVSLLQATLESTADGILVVDLQGRVVDFNERFIRMWRFPKDLLTEGRNRDVTAIGSDRQALQLLMFDQLADQLKDPAGFVAKVQKLYAHPEVTGFDMLEFKDGRVFERYSLPQCIEGRPVGRVWSFRDVTGRKLAEEALRASEERYRLLFNSSHDALLVAEGLGADGLPGRVIEVNDVACERLGYTREELLQKNLCDLDAPEFLPLVPAIMEKLKDKRHALWEGVHVAKNGRRIPVEVSADLFELNGRQTVLSSGRDISERKQAEEKLRESEERFRQIFDEGPNGMAIVGGDFRYLQANAAFCKMLGYAESELALLTYKDITHPDHVKQDEASMERLLRGDIPVYRTEKRYIRKDKQVVWGSMVATVIRDKQGRVLYYLIMVQDITEHKRTERAIRASLEEKTVLLKEVHHRVKNNLQIVVSLLNLQAVRVKNPAALDTLQETGNRVRSMALLHETLYRSQNLAHVNFASYIGSICNHLFYSYGPKTARVKLEQRMEEVSIDLDQAVSCGLIINELVSNALKHAFPEGREGRITVELQTAEQDRVILKVADDGVGLPAQLDLRQTETLGHQLVFMLAEKLRGAVEVTRDGGTAFCITFQTKHGEERL